MSLPPSPDDSVPVLGRPAYVEHVLSRLYPPPLQVGSASGRGAVAARYLLLPSPTQARIVVPAASPRLAAAAVRRQLIGARPRTRIARVLLSLTVASGAADWLPGQLAVTGPEDAESVETVLRALLGHDQLLLSMPVGPPRANRKPVLQVCDARTGCPLAFVKIGHDDLTSGLVVQEGEHLARLADARLAHVRAPRVLARAQWQGLSLLVLEPLPLPQHRLTGSAARQALLRVVREIAALDARPEAPWASHAFPAALDAQLGRCGPVAAPLREHLQRVGAGAPPVATGSWHGDLNPGNVALLPGTSLVWDWERFQHGVPVGFDLLHHDLHADITTLGTAPLAAARKLLDRAAGTLAPLGLLPAPAHATARLYLIALACRYLQDRQTEAGSDLGDITTWLLPALDSRPLPR